MKLLVTSINFHPDHSGIALYATDLPVYAASRGHQVTMVTGFPYYPRWRKSAGDRGVLLRRERHAGVRVLRGYLYVPRRVTTATRIAHELSFAAFAVLNFLRAGRHDCIVVLSPPLLLGLVGVLFKLLWGARLVVNVQDLQPDAALALGMVKPSLLTRLLLGIERLVYRHATAITTVSQGMRDRLLAKGVPPRRVAVCYNWIDVATAERRPEAGRFRARHPQAAGTFVVAYAGNVGVKQGLDVLVDLAAAMRDDSAVRFLLIGEGADRPRLAARAAALALPNLVFLPFLDAEAYREMLVDVDVCFVAQRPGAGNVFFPSKLLGIMALGRPLLVSADPDSELAVVVRDGGAGLVAPAHDVAALAEHVRRLRADPALAEDLGRGGRALVQRFDRHTVLSDFLAGLSADAPASSPTWKESASCHVP